jgi:hypothetical protein
MKLEDARIPLPCREDHWELTDEATFRQCQGGLTGMSLDCRA